MLSSLLHFFTRRSHSSLPADASPSSLLAYNSSTSTFTTLSPGSSITAIPLSTLRILTWNVDYSPPSPTSRLSSLVNYLSTLTPPPDILLLQEVHPCALSHLLTIPWIRSTFAITNTHLPSHSPKYGTVTLIHLRLAPSVLWSFRVPFEQSVMGRDLVFIDLRVVRPPRADTPAAEGGVFRIGNTHLESLAGWGKRAREEQMKEAMRLVGMEGVFAGLVAGDMNAIGEGDVELPRKWGGTDLWLERPEGATGEDEREGETWGFQPPCEFPPGRLDKVIAGQNVMLMASGINVVGRDLKTEEGQLVSDHCGLLADVRLGSRP